MRVRLQGAVGILSRGLVRYLEFENHHKGAWADIELSNVIGYLDRVRAAKVR